MPGTDMCLKIGGWVRAEARWGVNGNSVTGISNNMYNNRNTNNFWTRERGYITADAREQTAYGVARGYIAVGISSQNTGLETPSTNFNANRAFVQWAGFTAGLSVSFWDFYPAAALMINAAPYSEDTGDGGQWVWAYTAQFGGGVSATLSAEERRVNQIIGVSGVFGAIPTAGGITGTAGAGTGAGYGGWQSPDVVGNLRVDQAWGSAQVMAALHQVNAGYYGTLPTSGHPSDQWGWAVGGGIKINAPFVSPGDYFVAEVNYSNGAIRYNVNSASTNQTIVNGANEAFGIASDCVYSAGTGCELTSAWNFNAGFEHYWTPQWHQSLVGNYWHTTYDTTANARLCSSELAAAAAGCNNDWDVWGVGSRLQWDVTKTFYLAVDALYTHLDSASLPGGVLTANTKLSNSGATTVANESNWAFGLRMHKDFLP